jgi:hypothetical protein
MKITAVSKASQPIRSNTEPQVSFKAACQPIHNAVPQKDVFVKSKTKAAK